MEEALRVYDKHIVCLGKATEDCRASLNSLVQKAIKAYETRAAGLRHGIALDRQLTVILSQTDQERPLCGIYFNLHTPFRRLSADAASKARKRQPDESSD